MDSKRAGDDYNSYEGLRDNVIEYLTTKDSAKERKLCFGVGCTCSSMEGKCGTCSQCER